MRIKMSLLAVVMTLLLSGCSYYAVRDVSKETMINNPETFVYQNNQFQFFLNDDTVWNAGDFSSSNSAGRFNTRKFTISQMPIWDDEVESIYTITEMNPELSVKYNLKRFDKTANWNEFTVKERYELEDSTQQVVANIYKKVGDSIPFIYDVQIGTNQYTLEVVDYVPSKRLVMKLSDSTGVPVYVLRKEFRVFSNQYEFDLDRTQQIPEVVFVALTSVISREVAKIEGRYK